MSKPPQHRCSSGKTRYPDKLGAMIALASTHKAAERGNARRDEVRAYFCTKCRGWHLTSRRVPKRNAKRGAG